MAKKKPKTLNQAYELLALKRRYRNLSIIAIVGSVLIFIGYNIIVGLGLIGDTSMAPTLVVYVIFVVLAAVMGTFTYRWTRYSRELRTFCQQHSISESDL